MDNQILFERLSKIDSPTVTNVVATYASSGDCLGLYNPWKVNWYTDQTCRCIFPELARRPKIPVNPEGVNCSPPPAPRMLSVCFPYAVFLLRISIVLGI